MEGMRHFGGHRRETVKQTVRLTIEIRARPLCGIREICGLFLNHGFHG